MSFQVDQACYGTEQQAAQASAAKAIGAVVQHAGAAYVVDVSAVSGTSITYQLYPVAGGAAITVQTPYTAQPCGLLGIDDGLQLGWGVGAAWLGAFAILFLTRGLRG